MNAPARPTTYLRLTPSDEAVLIRRIENGKAGMFEEEAYGEVLALREVIAKATRNIARYPDLVEGDLYIHEQEQRLLHRDEPKPNWPVDHAEGE